MKTSPHQQHIFKGLEGFTSMSPKEFCRASLTISRVSKTLCLHDQALNPKLTHREPANILNEH